MDHLFNNCDLRLVLEEHQRKALEVVGAMAQDEILATPEKVTEQIVREYTVAPIQLTEAALAVEAEEVQIDVSQFPDRYIRDRSVPLHRPGTRVTYYLPYIGDKNLFRAHPSQYTLNPPLGTVTDKELQLVYERTDTDVGATKTAFDRDIGTIKQWLGFSEADVGAYNNNLPSVVAGAVDERVRRLQETSANLNTLGIPIRRRSTVSADAVLIPAAEPEPPAQEYDVALSFAGEQRDYVEAVAIALRETDVSVFYDDFEKVQLWGKNLRDHFTDVYQNRARFVVMFVSKEYVAKAWPRHERQVVQAKALYMREEFILPARFDDSEVPGMTSTVAYIDLRETTPEDFARLIASKLSSTGA